MPVIALAIAESDYFHIPGSRAFHDATERFGPDGVVGKWLTFSAQWGHFNQVNAYKAFAPGVPRRIDIVSQKEDGQALSAGRWSWRSYSRW